MVLVPLFVRTTWANSVFVLPSISMSHLGVLISFLVLSILSFHCDLICPGTGSESALWHRIKDFTEWAQCLVLDMVSKYIPSDSDESFDMMNILEDRLQHTNSAVVLATIKVFLHLTISMADVHQQVKSLSTV